MKTRAAVALEKAKPLAIAEVDLEGPKAGEVLVEIKATGICHTDEYTLSGADPEGLFPAALSSEFHGVSVAPSSGRGVGRRGQCAVDSRSSFRANADICRSPAASAVAVMW